MNKSFFFMFLLIPIAIFSQNVNGRISSSVYSFERFDENKEPETFFRAYESLILNINQDNFSIRTRVNYETNLSNSLVNDPKLRFYNLYFEGRDLLGLATVKVGRQSLFNSVAGGTYDGASLKLKYTDYQASVFYGGNVPAYQKLELNKDWKNNYVLGGKVSAEPIEDLYVALTYIDKNYKSEDYTVTRLDENYNPIDVLIKSKSNQFKFATAEVDYTFDKSLSFYTRVDYDINFETLSKYELNGNYKATDNLGINVYYNFREPRIRYNSIFTVFNYGNTQEIEAGLNYTVNKDFSLSGKFGNVEYKDDNSQRATVGLNTKFGNVSYRKTFGYAGELDAISLYSAKSFMDGFLTPSAGISFTSYKLSPDEDTNTLTSVLAGVNVRPLRTLSFDVQGQYFNNKIYENDLRLLIKLNYWFNTNLNLL
ncbi:MAG: hypothetical protein KJ799_01630 [Bacteroidetes bacterium]|nr:hypothetical protein [Bacteroidota bacterium]MBU2505412.1 hypothetical protein [Bacteroidota bacterium]